MGCRSTRNVSRHRIFTNALISVNWSGSSVDAAALARLICAEDAQMTLADIHAEVPLSPDALVMQLRKFELRHSMRALKGAAFATDIESTLSVGAPTVSDGLSGLVSMLGADLLVLGPIDWQDSVASELREWLIRRPASAPSAIAIAPRGFAANAPDLRRVGVLCDNLGAGRNGIATAQHLSNCLGSRFTVLQDLPTGPGIPTPRRTAIAAQRLASFSAQVDLLVTSAQDPRLNQRAKLPLLLINQPVHPLASRFETMNAGRPMSRGRSLIA